MRRFETEDLFPLCQTVDMHAWNRRANAIPHARGASWPGRSSFSAICVLSVLAGIVLLVELRTCIRVGRLVVSNNNQHQQKGDHDELEFKRPRASSGLFIEDGAEVKRRRDHTNRDRTKAYLEVTSSSNHRAIAMETPMSFAEETSALPSSSAPNRSSSAIEAGGYDPGKAHSSVGNFGTLTRLRHGECAASDCRVLITGCGRSGTHFLAEQLAGAGIPISHETIGEMGTVSWVHAAPFREEFRELEEWFSDDKSVELRSDKDFQFYPVFHLVRHPLAALTSLTECFCGCGSMSCGGWADPPSWKWAGKFVNFSDRYCSRTNNNEVCSAHKHPNGRLIRSMEYWLQWNQLSDSQAHFRLQLETVNLNDVVRAAPLLGTSGARTDAAAKKIIEQKPFASKRAKRRTAKAVSWESMRSADASLEAQVWELAQSYGYTRDAP